jgi:hypothetical protein
MNLNAIEAAIICKTIVMIKRTVLTIAKGLTFYKNMRIFNLFGMLYFGPVNLTKEL